MSGALCAPLFFCRVSGYQSQKRAAHWGDVVLKGFGNLAAHWRISGLGHGLCATLLLAAGPASGAEAMSPHQLEEGRYLASLCTTCHQPDRKTRGIPRITGYSSKEMLEMMMEYRGGEVHHGAMENIAQSLNDAELRVLADYLALTFPPAPRKTEAGK